jgi:hypothetical protein
MSVADFQKSPCLNRTINCSDFKYLEVGYLIVSLGFCSSDLNALLGRTEWSEDDWRKIVKFDKKGFMLLNLRDLPWSEAVLRVLKQKKSLNLHGTNLQGSIEALMIILLAGASDIIELDMR